MYTKQKNKKYIYIYVWSILFCIIIVFKTRYVIYLYN